MQTFRFQGDPANPRLIEHDAKQAMAMWLLGWASRVIMDDPDDDAPASVEVTLVDDWEGGPSDMVAWVRTKLNGS